MTVMQGKAGVGNRGVLSAPVIGCLFTPDDYALLTQGNIAFGHAYLLCAVNAQPIGAQGAMALGDRDISLKGHRALGDAGVASTNVNISTGGIDR